MNTFIKKLTYFNLFLGLTTLSFAPFSFSQENSNLTYKDQEAVLLEAELLKNAAWATPSVTKLQSSTFFTKKIPLTIFTLARSGWTLERTVSELRLAEKIFAQCAFSFSPITYVHSETTINIPYDYKDDADIIFFENSPIEKRPLIIVDYDNSMPQKSRRGGYAHYKKTADHPSYKTGFLFERGLEHQQLRERELELTEPDKLSPKKYSVLAHELAHLIFRTEHTKKPYGLLYLKPSFKQLGHQIEDSQCESIADSFYH